MEGEIHLPERVNKIRDEDGRTLHAWFRRNYMPIPYVAAMDDRNARRI